MLIKLRQLKIISTKSDLIDNQSITSLKFYKQNQAKIAKAVYHPSKKIYN